jgi:hypothetical protein
VLLVLLGDGIVNGLGVLEEVSGLVAEGVLAASVLGELVELVELVEEADAPFKEARVCASRLPETEMPWEVWYAFRALVVFGPRTPSIAPGSWPLSFSACCACRTELSALDAPFREAEAEVEVEGDGNASVPALVALGELFAAKTLPAESRAPARMRFLDFIR